MTSPTFFTRNRSARRQDAYAEAVAAIRAADSATAQASVAAAARRGADRRRNDLIDDANMKVTQAACDEMRALVPSAAATAQAAGSLAADLDAAASVATVRAHSAVAGLSGRNRRRLHKSPDAPERTSADRDQAHVCDYFCPPLEQPWPDFDRHGACRERSDHFCDRLRAKVAGR